MSDIIDLEATAVKGLMAILPDSCSLDELTVVVQKFPNAFHVPDEDGFVPLHCACQHGCSSQVI